MAICCLSTAETASSQESFRISLEVTEDTPGLFASAFGGALRSLGDVVVVGEEEDADYFLRAVVLCDQNECKGSNSYSLSILFGRKLRARDLALALFSAARPESLDQIQQRALYERALKQEEAISSKDFEVIFRHTMVAWGRDRYQAAAREFVAEIDRVCLENDRAFNRLDQASSAEDQAATLAIFNGVVERAKKDFGWGCY